MLPTYIVIIDSDMVYLELAARFLTKQDNVIVSGVIAGSDAVFSSAQVFEPDIMLYNLNNSTFNQGLEAISQLKKICPRTHLIAVASHGEDQNRQQVLLAGANTFVKRTCVNIEFLPMIWKLITMYRKRYQKWEMGTAPLPHLQEKLVFQSNTQIH